MILIDFMVLIVCIINVILAITNKNLHAVGGWLVASLAWLKIILPSIT